MSAPSRIYLIAGEPSGDVLGGRLISSLEQLSEQPVEVKGVGGPAMSKAGMTSLFPMNDLAVMGLTEVLPRLPTLLRRISETSHDIRSFKPDVIVTIDAPDFCLRVAKKIKDLNIPIVHYVAPSVWAWRPGRARKIAQIVDHVLCLLPFEPPYFEREGMRATFVGHSILESGANRGDATRFRNRYSLSDEVPVLCVLPGSRTGEVNRLMDVFERAFSMLQADVPQLEVVVPTVETVASIVEKRWGNLDRVKIVLGDDQKYDAMSASSIALAASGTVSLELAMAGVPTVVAYQVAPLTAFIAKRMLSIRYVSIVNLIAEEEVVPEFLQGECTSENLYRELSELLDNETKRNAQISSLSGAIKQLRPSSTAPSTNAARVVIAEAGKSKKSGA